MSATKISRRKFLKVAGITVAATTLTCSGMGYVATRKPDIERPELTFGGEDKMSNKVLVTYATRAGSTAEIAATIGESLGERGFTVDVKPIKEAPDPSGYDSVLIGSPIRMGKWLPEAVKFVEAHQATLGTMPVSLFTVHMLHAEEDEASRAARAAYLDPIRPLLKDVEAIYFEGAIDYSRLSFLDRFIAKVVGSTETDNRDWDEIRSWVPEALA
ncbi:MAG: flavodoxin domain-containing protein [Anaerolineales bacterium]